MGLYEVLSDRAVIQVTGSDAFRFLQNLTTNDLANKDYCYCYMLSNQGRFLFDFFISKLFESEFLLDVHVAQIDDLIQKLSMYKLRADVKFTKKEEFQIIYSYNILDFPVIFSGQDPRFNKLHLRSIVDRSFCDDIGEKNLYIEDKYNFTIPDGYIDLICDKSIPVEYGAEELEAISYTKGCYIGQEVISRAKYQGVVRKKLFKILSKIDITYIPKLSEIKVDDITIGKICSSYKNIGIALIREEKYLELVEKKATIEDVEIAISLPSWREA